jgi:hypothetical protein
MNHKKITEKINTAWEDRYPKDQKPVIVTVIV